MTEIPEGDDATDGGDSGIRTAPLVRARTGRDLSSIRDTFARELDAALDRMPGVPSRGVGRVAWLARRFGVGETAPRKWLSGIALPAMDKFVELVEVLNVSPQRLLRGVDPTYVDLGKLADTRALEGREIAALRPVQAEDAQGGGGEAQLALSESFIRSELHPGWDGSGSLAWTTATSDDMTPAIRAGDRLLFLRQSDRALPGEIHLLRFGLSPQLLVRRLHAEGGRLVARCDNPPPGSQDFMVSVDPAGGSITGGLTVAGLVLCVLRPTVGQTRAPA